MSKPKDHGRYSKVSRRMWNDEDFRELSAPQPNGQTLWKRLLTGPELTNIPGCIPVFDAGLARALRWPLEGFLKAFGEVSAKGMAKADWDAGLVWVPNSIKHNEPENPNVVLSWQTAWEELPECALKLEAWHSLREYLEVKGLQWVTAFDRACRKPCRKGYPKGIGKVEPKNSAPFGESETGAVTETGSEDPSDRRVSLDVADPPDDHADDPAEEAPSETRLVLAPVETTKSDRTKADARWVFECWKHDTGHHRAILDAKREALIRSRLRQGFTREQLRDAIVNRRNDPWLMGKNPDGKIYDTISCLLRDAEQVERLLAMTEPPMQGGDSGSGRAADGLGRQLAKIQALEAAERSPIGPLGSNPDLFQERKALS